MSEPLKVGAKAPDFTNPGVRGEEERDFRLYDYLGAGRNALIVFYAYDWTGI